MAEIPQIRIRSVGVPRVPDYLMEPPQAIPSSVPVTVQIGFPVVDLPGCIEVHETNNAKNNQIKTDDERGVLTFCDGHIPSFNPINFNEEVELPTPKPPIPPYKAPEVPGIPEIPKDAIPKPKEEELPCPGPNAPRIGDVAQSKKEKVSGFELQTVNGQQICVTLYEPIPFTEQYLPAPQVIASTAGIAAVATTSALLAKPIADLLLKVVKPLVKKTIKKIAAKLGKHQQHYSVSERREIQRELSQAIRIMKNMKK